MSGQDLKEADDLIVKDTQKALQGEMMKTDRKGSKGGRFSRLRPVLEEGSSGLLESARLIKYNVMTPDS